jgi:hypothetical protein
MPTALCPLLHSTPDILIYSKWNFILLCNFNIVPLISTLSLKKHVMAKLLLRVIIIIIIIINVIDPIARPVHIIDIFAFLIFDFSNEMEENYTAFYL